MNVLSLFASRFPNREVEVLPVATESFRHNEQYVVRWNNFGFLVHGRRVGTDGGIIVSHEGNEHCLSSVCACCILPFPGRVGRDESLDRYATTVGALCREHGISYLMVRRASHIESRLNAFGVKAVEIGHDAPLSKVPKPRQWGNPPLFHSFATMFRASGRLAPEILATREDGAG